MCQILLLVLSVLLFAGCAEGTARFRPATGAKGYPPSADAYRVKAPPTVECESLGFVIEAERLEDVLEATKRVGGTHYQILDDFGDPTIETDTAIQRGAFGTVNAHSSSRKVDHHQYTARVYHC